MHCPTAFLKQFAASLNGPLSDLKNLIKIRQIQFSYLSPATKMFPRFVTQSQCDQIGLFIGLCVTFQSHWQQLICPNLPHS